MVKYLKPLLDIIALKFLGLVFIAAGVSHFTLKRAYCNIVPPYGCWGGLWRVPAPGAEAIGLTYEEFHTYWSGIAEIAGGLLLMASFFGIVDIPVNIPSFLLGMLVSSEYIPLVSLFLRSKHASMSAETMSTIMKHYIRCLSLHLPISLCSLMMLKWEKVFPLFQ